VPNFVSVLPSVAELAGGEKSRNQSLSSLSYSVTHPAYLMARELKLSLRNIVLDSGRTIFGYHSAMWYSDRLYNQASATEPQVTWPTPVTICGSHLGSERETAG